MMTALVPAINDRSHPFAGRTETCWNSSSGGVAGEAALAGRMASGDIAALDELYRCFRSAAFATAYALLHDASAAEDAVHDAFLRAWRSAASFQPDRGALRSWLLRVVRNTAIDQLRARHLALRSQPKLFNGPFDGHGEADIFVDIALAADARRLRDALHALPAAQRHVLELAFFAGLTHGEIAAQTGTPLGTVKGRVRLGLRRLRRELADLAMDPEELVHCDSPVQAA